MKPIRTILLMTALVGAGCTKDAVMDELTVTTVGPLGGTAVSADALTVLELPADAVANDTAISIRVERGGLVRPAVKSALYQFGPDGLQFAKPVRLSMAANHVDRPAIAQITDTQTIILGDSTLDGSTARVSAHLAHFSTYAVVSLWDACANKTCSDACTLCDPADTTCVEPSDPHACDQNGACVLATNVTCTNPQNQPDTGVALDTGTPDIGTPDTGAQGRPDSGIHWLHDENEPNDTIATAEPSQAYTGRPMVLRASISPAGDVDVFSVDVTPAFAELLATTHSDPADRTACTGGLDTYLTLYDAAGNVLAENDDAPNRMFCSTIDVVVTAGRYYVAVRHFAAQSGLIPLYYLSIEQDAAAQPDGGVLGGPDANVPDSGPVADGGVVTPPDAGTTTSTTGLVNEVEPNDGIAMAQASNVLVGGAVDFMGSIDPAGDHDVFSVDVPPGGASLRATTYVTAGDRTSCRPANIDTYLTLYASNGTVLAMNDDDSRGFCSTIEQRLPAGTYFVEVRGYATPLIIPLYYLGLILSP